MTGRGRAEGHHAMAQGSQRGQPKLERCHPQPLPFSRWERGKLGSLLPAGEGRLSNLVAVHALDGLQELVHRRERLGKIGLQAPVDRLGQRRMELRPIRVNVDGRTVVQHGGHAGAAARPRQLAGADFVASGVESKRCPPAGRSAGGGQSPGPCSWDCPVRTPGCWNCGFDGRVRPKSMSLIRLWARSPGGSSAGPRRDGRSRRRATAQRLGRLADEVRRSPSKTASRAMISELKSGPSMNSRTT